MAKESSISKSLIDELNTRPGVFAWKNHGGRYSIAGFPDVGVLWRSSMVPTFVGCLVEMKKPGEVPTPIQERFHKKIRGRMKTEDAVLVCHSKREAIERLEWLGMPREVTR